ELERYAREPIALGHEFLLAVTESQVQPLPRAGPVGKRRCRSQADRPQNAEHGHRRYSQILWAAGRADQLFRMPPGQSEAGKRSKIPGSSKGLLGPACTCAFIEPRVKPLKHRRTENAEEIELERDIRPDYRSSPKSTYRHWTSRPGNCVSKMFGG